jgi:hypothetical protein
MNAPLRLGVNAWVLGISILSVIASPCSRAAEDRVFLARFEITKYGIEFPGSPRPRTAIILYAVGKSHSPSGDVEVERIQGAKDNIAHMGPMEADVLMARLEELALPGIDYQAYFDRLSKAQSHKEIRVLAGNCPEVEVELSIKGTRVKFRMFAPNIFLYNHSDDQVVAVVRKAIDAFFLALGKDAVFFSM